VPFTHWFMLENTGQKTN